MAEGAALFRPTVLTALWLNHQPRNSWIGVDGIGWRKLAATNDSK